MPLVPEEPTGATDAEARALQAARLRALLAGGVDPTAPALKESGASEPTRLVPSGVPGVSNLDASGLAPGQSMSAGPGRPIIVGPAMSGQDVLARGDITPQSRSFFERAEAGRASDARNPIIQALGGAQADYGESGVIPTLQQAGSRLGRDISPAEYAALLRTGSEAQGTQGNQQLATMELLGKGGKLAQGQSMIDSNASSRLNEVQRFALYQAHMNNPANGRTTADRQRSWDANYPRPASILAGGGAGQDAPQPGLNPYIGAAGGPGVPASPGDANLPRPPQMSLAPPIAGGVQTGTTTTPGQTRISSLAGPQTQNGPTPAAVMEATHGEVTGDIAGRDAHNSPLPLPAGKNNEAITRFVHGLNSESPNFIKDNIKEIMPFMIRKFGEQAANDWFTHNFWRMGPETSHERAIGLIKDAANRKGANVGSNSVNPQRGGLLSSFGAAEPYMLINPTR